MGTGFVCLVIRTWWHNPFLPITRFCSKYGDNQESPGNWPLLALGHCELSQHFFFIGKSIVLPIITQGIEATETLSACLRQCIWSLMKLPSSILASHPCPSWWEALPGVAGNQHPTWGLFSSSEKMSHVEHHSFSFLKALLCALPWGYIPWWRLAGAWDEVTCGGMHLAWLLACSFPACGRAQHAWPLDPLPRGSPGTSWSNSSVRQ